MEEIIINNKTFVKVNCSKCGKEIIRLKCYYNHQIKRSKSGKPYCSASCAKDNRYLSPESIQKIKYKQKGISVMSRGRKGHIITQETKDKIRLSKLGVPAPKDFQVIINEIKLEESTKTIPLVKRIPDGIIIRNNKVIAFEVEKEPAMWGIRNKMNLYDDDTIYDEVIIIWYRDNIKIGKFHKVNGVWSGLIPTPAG